MRQTLFYIPAVIAGRPVFGFGLLLFVWAVVSAAVLLRLWRRHGFGRELAEVLPTLLLVGAIIAWILPALVEYDGDGVPLGLPIRGYGVMVLLAITAATALAAWRAKSYGLNAEQVLTLLFWLLVPGIIGARAFYVIEYWPEYWRAYTEPGGGLRPFLVGVVNIARGGLVIYGAILGGLAGLWLFARKYRHPPLTVADLVSPSLMLGLALGRIGCFLNGCCFGGVCECSWAVRFPPEAPAYLAQVQRGQFYGFALTNNSAAEPKVLEVKAGSPADQAGLQPGDVILNINRLAVSNAGEAFAVLAEMFHQRQPLELRLKGRSELLIIPAVEPPPRSLPVYPTQLISAVNALLLSLVLLGRSCFRRREGEISALMFTLYPVVRFVEEILRDDEAAVFGTGMSISQNISVILLVCAVGLWCYILHCPTKNRVAPALSSSPVAAKDTASSKSRSGK